MAPVTLRLEIESLDLDANGVARNDGKVVFVRGALTGETVTARIVRRKPKYDVAEVDTIERASAQRVLPRCPNFGICGGCSMQHIEPRAQVSLKQRVLEDTLWHIGKVRAETMLAPIVGPAYGYRYRARLSVRHVLKKGGVLVGFHERGSSFVADMRECHVLPPAASALLVPLRELVGALSIRDRMPQVEMAHGETHIELVLRVLQSPTDEDRLLLRQFSERHAVALWLQSSGPDSIEYLCGPAGSHSTLHYALPAFGVVMPFRPTDFTQVNHAINATLVSRALSLLDVQAHERIADLFCGLGNFTLPLATQAAEVLGIEGSKTLVERACANALANGLQAKASFRAANLFQITPQTWQSLGAFDRLLIDPPREGAHALVQALIAPGSIRPRRIVYVSCNPATLARDAAILIHEGGLVLRTAGVINMFPHTSHVESIAVFEQAD